MTPKEGTPDKIAETTPHFSPGDFSFLEIIMAMQNTMGRLPEAVDSLKAQSVSHGNKLEEIGKEIHAVKRVGGALVVVGGILGFVVHELLPFLMKLKQP
jgi:putative effector of murein hydrolase